MAPYHFDVKNNINVGLEMITHNNNNNNSVTTFRYKFIFSIF